MELLREEKTVNELASEHQISPVLISRWKAEFMERAAEIFKKGPSDTEKELAEKEAHIADLERCGGRKIRRRKAVLWTWSDHGPS